MPLQIPAYPIVFVRTKRRLMALEWIISVSLLVLLVGVGLYMWRWEIVKGYTIRKVMNKADVGFWLYGVVMVLGVAFNIYAYRANQSARLVIDALGIRMEPQPDAKWLATLLGRRKLAWGQLTHVSHLSRFNLIQLVQTGTLATIWPLRLSDWQLESAAGQSAQPPSRNRQPDLLRVFHEIGVFERFPPSAAAESMNFDLMGHPATRLVLVVLGLLGLYAVADRFVQREAWAFFNSAYVVPHVVVGLLMACAVLVYLKRVRLPQAIPNQVALGLPVLALLVAGAASYIGGIRINQAFGGPLVSADYRRNAGCDTLVPQDAKLPIVEYTPLAGGYWCSIPASQSIPVRVRQGFFGLYQMDLSDHTEAIRAWRQTH